MPSFIFDVDGTLTPSRGRINKHFAAWFEHFITHNAVYFVTGSDKDKTVEQLGQNIYMSAIRSYQCSGNDVYEGGKNIKRNNVDWHPHTIGFYSKELQRSEYPVRAGVHVENRPGLANFSIVGRAATSEQRKDYVIYDKRVNERRGIADRFNKQFSQYQASVAGDIGIDIVPIGCNKSQIVPDFYKKGDIYFFGDNCDPGGNDYEIAIAVEEIGGIVYNVKDWQHTWEILKAL